MSMKTPLLSDAVYGLKSATVTYLYVSQPVKVVAGSDRAHGTQFTTNQAWKITYEEDADEGAARDIPYNIITQVIE